MKAFIVELRNRPGELATVAEVIARAGVNVTSFIGMSYGDHATAALVTDNDAATRRALSGTGHAVREVELVSALLADEPGSLARATRRLGEAGVNIDAAMTLERSEDHVHVAFATDDPEAARKVLGGHVVPGLSRP